MRKKRAREEQRWRRRERAREMGEERERYGRGERWRYGEKRDIDVGGDRKRDIEERVREKGER